ncbi:MAG: hypothetical protein QM736_18040 [Vicinamibacterales bacterium]
MFTLSSVVPWGRSFDEYQRMFALTPADLEQPIVGCGDGPASFNAEGTRRGYSIVSCDPIYRFTVDELRQRIEETRVDILEQTRRNAGEFVWTSIRSVDELGEVRMAAMQRFLDDYTVGRAERRYVDASLPELPFADSTFGLALASHLLFLYTAQLDLPFHIRAVEEMCRVATEVRVFPLLALEGAPSPYVNAVADEFRSRGHLVSIERVPYQFQRGGHDMLRITRESTRS